MAEQLTTQELLAIFDRPSVASRYIPAADSSEYLNLVTWLVKRSHEEAA